MVGELFYINQKTGKLQTNKTKLIKGEGYLRKIYEKQLIDRFRDGSEYVYCLKGTEKDTKWVHWNVINTFHFMLYRQLAIIRIMNDIDWPDILFYEFEVDYKIGRADGFYIVRLGKDRVVKFFLECENNSLFRFDKVEKYNKKYEEYWDNEFWADPFGNGIKSFPMIVVVTKNKKRVEKIVKRENRNGLIFRVCNIDDVKRNVIAVILGVKGNEDRDEVDENKIDELVI